MINFDMIQQKFYLIKVVFYQIFIKVLSKFYISSIKVLSKFSLINIINSVAQ